jgi:hypothetical protein
VNKLRIAAILALVVPCIAAAQDAGKFRCTNGEMVRRVEIYTEPGRTVPCEVHYFKDTEVPAEPEVLWSAQADAEYCQEKATSFVAKLEEWGWTCQSPQVEPQEEQSPETDAGDDTEVLSPADS